jgi:hypothetical protein
VSRTRSGAISEQVTLPAASARHAWYLESADAEQTANRTDATTKGRKTAEKVIMAAWEGEECEGKSGDGEGWVKRGLQSGSQMPAGRGGWARWMRTGKTSPARATDAIRADAGERKRLYTGVDKANACKIYIGSLSLESKQISRDQQSLARGTTRGRALERTLTSVERVRVDASVVASVALPPKRLHTDQVLMLERATMSSPGVPR